MNIKGKTLGKTLADILIETNPFSLFLILILLLLAFGEGNNVAMLLKRIFSMSPKGGE